MGNMGIKGNVGNMGEKGNIGNMKNMWNMGNMVTRRTHRGLIVVRYSCPRFSTRHCDMSSLEPGFFRRLRSVNKGGGKMLKRGWELKMYRFVNTNGSIDEVWDSSGEVWSWGPLIGNWHTRSKWSNTLAWTRQRRHQDGNSNWGDNGNIVVGLWNVHSTFISSFSSHSSQGVQVNQWEIAWLNEFDWQCAKDGC
jgi:hypothetical protein